MKNRISKKFNWPHPLLKSQVPISYTEHLADGLPPPTFQPFESSLSAEPCPHVFRASTYTLGDKPSINAPLELGVIVTPFGGC